jgi:hypothetical protein
MNFLKSIFSSSLFADPKDLVDKYISEVNVFQKGPLSISYQYLLTSYIVKA